MNNKTKTIIAVGIVSIVGYLIWKNQYKKTTATTDTSSTDTANTTATA